MSRLVAFWRVLAEGLLEYRAQFAHASRVTIAAALSFAVGKFLGVPLVLWPVLTAIVLTQLSVGKSVKAIIDYFFGTLAGGAYAALIALLIPHASDIMLKGVMLAGNFAGTVHPGIIATLVPQADNLALAFTLVIVLAPLAFLAALSPRFSAAPFTGALVVFIPTIANVSPLASAFDRILEVLLGGVIALLVSVVIFPARAHAQVREVAAEMIGFMAQVVPELFASLTSDPDVEELHAIQRRIGQPFMKLNVMMAEARHERITLLTTLPDAETLLRALLRLRHDFIMVGRAAATPFPPLFRERLEPLLRRIATITAVHLNSCATALRTGVYSSFADGLNEAFEKYSLEMVVIRREGVLKECSFDAVEHVFTISFALEQLRQNLCDLESRVLEQAGVPAKRALKRENTQGTAL